MKLNQIEITKGSSVPIFSCALPTFPAINKIEIIWEDHTNIPNQLIKKYQARITLKIKINKMEIN